jgi:hypothetical protein
MLNGKALSGLLPSFSLFWFDEREFRCSLMFFFVGSCQIQGPCQTKAHSWTQWAVYPRRRLLLQKKMHYRFPCVLSGAAGYDVRGQASVYPLVPLQEVPEFKFSVQIQLFTHETCKRYLNSSLPWTRNPEHTGLKYLQYPSILRRVHTWQFCLDAYVSTSIHMC